jgi:transposase-like protein
MRPHRLGSAPIARSAFARFYLPPDVIVLAVRWYLRFGLSYRDIEELLAERGIEVVTPPSTAGCSASRRC